MNKEQAKGKIKKLVEEYEGLKQGNSLKDKNEAFAKQRFIQPLFEALGWDFRRDVWPEERVSNDRADYAFKIDDFTKFFIEAKKFSVNIDDEQWAEQAIEYSWNKSVTWAILTNFETLKIFNSEWEQKPYHPIKEFQYTEYLDRFDELWFLSKESIEKGELDLSAEAWGVKEKKVPVTERLARDLTEWRDDLVFEVREWNKDKFSEAEIDEAVQRFLDRLIFIRYTEDKIFKERILEPIIRENKDESGDLIPKLNKIFWQYDRWFDSRLFEKGHFSEKMEIYSSKLMKVIRGLYRSSKDSPPYNFAIISSDVLGKVYEQYLGYIQKKKPGRELSKRKLQGIYYTPEYIVDFIVRNTLGELLKTKNDRDAGRIKILDPACGSGSFLIKAYQVMIDYFEQNQSYKTEKDTQMREIEKAMCKKEGKPRLSVAQKIKILRENIYGVDLDVKAVEIAQLNLLLKALESKTKLPNLSRNIVCGNSLITEGDMRYNPFNFKKEFAEVFNQGGFDIIIGNPPYIKEYTNKTAFDGLHDSQYYQGKMDIWTLFACVAIDLLKDGGYFSFIAPNNWVTNAGASLFRNKILAEGEIVKYIDFGDFKVFKDAGIQTMIYIFKKKKSRAAYKIQYVKVENKNLDKNIIAKFLASDSKDKIDGISVFEAPINSVELKNNTISFSNRSVNNILNKLSGKKNFVLDQKEVGQGIVAAPDKYFLEKNIDKFDNHEKEFLKPYYTSSGRYKAGVSDNFIFYISDKNFKSKILKDFPNIQNHFEPFKKILTEAKIKYGTPNKPYYYLHREREDKFFNKGSKIVCAVRTESPAFFYTEDQYYGSRALNFIKTERINLKYLTSLLNSTLIYFWLKNKGKQLGDLLQIDKGPLFSIPLIKPSEKIQKEMAEMTDKIIKLNMELCQYAEKSEKWHKVKQEIETMDKEIDQKVYELYGLTEEEIKIVEEK